MAPTTCRQVTIFLTTKNGNRPEMEYTAVIKVPFDQSGYDDGHRGDFCPHTCTVLVDVTMDTCWDFTGEPTLTVLIAAASPASNFLLTSHRMHVTTACMTTLAS